MSLKGEKRGFRCDHGGVYWHMVYSNLRGIMNKIITLFQFFFIVKLGLHLFYSVWFYDLISNCLLTNFIYTVQIRISVNSARDVNIGSGGKLFTTRKWRIPQLALVAMSMLTVVKCCSPCDYYVQCEKFLEHSAKNRPELIRIPQKSLNFYDMSIASILERPRVYMLGYAKSTGKICMFRNNGAPVGSRHLTSIRRITNASILQKNGFEDFNVTFTRRNNVTIFPQFKVMLPKSNHPARVTYTQMVGRNCTEKV